MKEGFYVNIKNPRELKGNLLDCSKGIIHSLQNYNDYIDLKEKKEAYLFKLEENIAQIAQMSLRLKEILPEEELESLGNKFESKKSEKNLNLEKLNKELADIEKKISKLNL